MQNRSSMQQNRGQTPVPPSTDAIPPKLSCLHSLYLPKYKSLLNYTHRHGAYKSDCLTNLLSIRLLCRMQEVFKFHSKTLKKGRGKVTVGGRFYLSIAVGYFLSFLASAQWQHSDLHIIIDEEKQAYFFLALASH